MKSERNQWFADVVVVGGGIAGLTAAAQIARSGRSVMLLEKAPRLGGRGGTQETHGVRFNLGPHALYCGGVAMRTLRELGVPFHGAPPVYQGLTLRDEGRLFAGPVDLKTLLTCRLFHLREKWQLARLPKTLARVDARSLDRIPLSDWIAANFGRGALARFIRWQFRVSTYVTDADLLSAGAAIDQLRVARDGGVWYLDGGWQTLIDGLRDVVLCSGGQVLESAPARSVRSAGSEAVVTLGDGSELRAAAVVLAVEPQTAIQLLDLPSDAPLVRWESENVPVAAACLDVALRRLPQPTRRVAFGLDAPLYYSVHSASAKLAEPGVAVVHVARYLSSVPGRDPSDVQGELEQWLDQVQPGWRDEVITRRYLPHMVVTHSLVTAKSGGAAGRPTVDATNQRNAFVCGDWVGPEGMLADAAVASAMQAAQRAVECASTAGEQRWQKPSPALASAGRQAG